MYVWTVHCCHSNLLSSVIQKLTVATWNSYVIVSLSLKLPKLPVTFFFLSHKTERSSQPFTSQRAAVTSKDCVLFFYYSSHPSYPSLSLPLSLIFLPGIYLITDNMINVIGHSMQSLLSSTQTDTFMHTHAGRYKVPHTQNNLREDPPRTDCHLFYQFAEHLAGVGSRMGRGDWGDWVCVGGHTQRGMQWLDLCRA